MEEQTKVDEMGRWAAMQLLHTPHWREDHYACQCGWRSTELSEDARFEATYHSHTGE